MSSMLDPIHPEQMGHPGSMQFSTAVPTFRIKRPGARPLIFEGIELAMAISFTPALPYWYEINLYRTNDQHFVVAVRMFFQSEDEQDQVRAWECETLDQALDKLAKYDAAQDVRFQVDLANVAMPPAALAAMALDLRSRIDGARRHYESLVGEFFYEFDAIKGSAQRNRA